MAENYAIHSCLMFIFLITHLVYTLGKSKPWTSMIPSNKGFKIRDDPEAMKLGTSDYGHIYRDIPAGVVYPSSINGIASFVKFANNVSVPFSIAVRGQGHSVRGQAMTNNGVVLNMMSLRNYRNGYGVIVSTSCLNSSLGNYYYADVGGEQLWVDVLNETLKYGFAPVSWTDYLHITVGGTLSNAGISGQTFRFGPQITNVYELDVVTGIKLILPLIIILISVRLCMIYKINLFWICLFKLIIGKGNILTCSAEKNSELFYAVLGGLGQFGIIVRARIALEPAPKRVSHFII